MGARRTQSSLDQSYHEPPAKTLDAREDQLIGLAVDLVEKRLREGTASSAEVVHFLKMGSRKNRQEVEKSNEEIKLLRAKTKQIENEENTADAYREVIQALGIYSGKIHSEEEDEDEDDEF